MTFLDFSPSTIAWFRSYLTNRSFLVDVDSTLSEPAKLTCGVPQGLILGSLIFLLYINDLPQSVKHCDIRDGRAPDWRSRGPVFEPRRGHRSEKSVWSENRPRYIIGRIRSALARRLVVTEVAQAVKRSFSRASTIAPCRCSTKPHCN